ncbi:nucleoside triphosphate pyrophosphohydrolase family protein [Halomicrobium katesii]|uniref:hypothetical protein n=1 Tax=Halomicrobium katesii TaxID=437163 RepID=UPI00037B6783|nr:hypothetical protein [Halomicrobium katesii]
MTDRETHVDDERGLFIPEDLREFDAQIVFRTPWSTIQHFGSRPLEAYYGMIRADQFGDPDEMRDAKNPDLAPQRVKIKPQGADPVTLTVDVDPQIRADGGSEEPEASSAVFDRWIAQADRNIEEWGLQDEVTLLLAIQEELGELTQAHLEARDEDGDPDRVDEELDDLGALLLQFHERRHSGDV